MTDRVRILTVVLDQDFRTDDVEAIMTVIAGVKHVAEVEKGPPVTAEDHMARQSVRIEIFNAIRDFTYEACWGKPPPWKK
jgi:hypothetical protein